MLSSPSKFPSLQYIIKPTNLILAMDALKPSNNEMAPPHVLKVVNE
jgi:hypothetical protein